MMLVGELKSIPTVRAGDIMFRALISITNTSRTILLITPRKIVMRRQIVLKQVDALDVRTEIDKVLTPVETASV